MSNELVEVRLFPIPPLNVRDEAGQEKLREIIAKGPDWPHYFLQLSATTANGDIIPFHYIPIEFSHPPYDEKQIRTIKYHVVHKIEDSVSGLQVFYGFPISE